MKYDCYTLLALQEHAAASEMQIMGAEIGQLVTVYELTLPRSAAAKVQQAEEQAGCCKFSVEKNNTTKHWRSVRMHCQHGPQDFKALRRDNVSSQKPKAGPGSRPNSKKAHGHCVKTGG